MDVLAKLLDVVCKGSHGGALAFEFLKVDVCRQFLDRCNLTIFECLVLGELLNGIVEFVAVFHRVATRFPVNCLFVLDDCDYLTAEVSCELVRDSYGRHLSNSGMIELLNEAL